MRILFIEISVFSALRTPFAAKGVTSLRKTARQILWNRFSILLSRTQHLSHIWDKRASERLLIWPRNSSCGGSRTKARIESKYTDRSGSWRSIQGLTIEL